MEENRFTYEDVFNVLNSMDGIKKEFLIESIDLSQLLNMLNSKEAFEAVLKNIDDCIARYQLLEAHLVELKTKLITGEYNVAGVIDKNTISEKYDDLKEDDKKDVVLNLMNNGDFQKKCCEILSSDMKRCINTDAILRILDRIFGVSKYFDRLISTGIGCNHQYRIE